MMNLHERFLKLKEYYAAGLFENEDRSLFYRKSLALRRYYENVSVPKYTGAKLYPSGLIPIAETVAPWYLNGFGMDEKTLESRDAELFRAFKQSEFFRFRSTVPSEHTVAGNMHTHSVPNFGRILKEGFDAYWQRIASMKDAEMRDGLTHVMQGLKNYHERCITYLKSVHADDQLINALSKVPFKPCSNIYEAVVAWNFVLYLDNCDNLGPIGSELLPYYHGEDITDLLENLYDNLDQNNGYSMSLGVIDSPLTKQCLAASKGKRRPMIELFVDENTSDEVWDQALASVLSGNGQPAFYNLDLYREGFLSRFPQVTETDLSKLCGVGCTEMSLAGLSNIGSLDAGVNLLLILERSIYRRLPEAKSFTAFYDGYLEDVHTDVLRVMKEISRSQKLRAQYVPLPMRTLLTDDCIEREIDFNAGGARYMWSIINFAGIINVIDSLLVIKNQVFDTPHYTRETFLRQLQSGDESFLKRAKENKNRFGIDCDEANALSHAFTHTIFSYLKEDKPYLGLAFLPASIQFRSYAYAGAQVGATPCGRKSSEALCDSLSAIFNKDTEGPTALLNSVASLDLSAALGTPVVNLTVNKDCAPAILKALIQGYMKQGGMQLQITCVSKEELLAAYEAPEEHKNLVVRVGGYSEYFYRLEDALKKKIIERTYHL